MFVALLGVYLVQAAGGALGGGLSLVMLSALGAVLLNLVLALNHRPGRYLGL